MSPTQSDGTHSKTSHSDTASTARPSQASALPNRTEDATMKATRTVRQVEATLARMALVRRHALSVNGAYRHEARDA